MTEDVPLRHRLAVNTFLLKAIQFAENHPEQVELIQRLHEQYWLGNPLRVRLPQADKPVGLSPDLLVTFETYQPLNQQWLPVEINLSREWEKDWEVKVRSYLYCLPAYQERLGTDILTTIPVMVVSPTAYPRRLYIEQTPEVLREKAIEQQRTERRMRRLKEWTEKILDSMNVRQDADLFSFSAAPLDELTPDELFLDAHWYIPFSDTPRPLLHLRKAGV